MPTLSLPQALEVIKEERQAVKFNWLTGEEAERVL
jgi:hypothetical protein